MKHSHILALALFLVFIMLTSIVSSQQGNPIDTDKDGLTDQYEIEIKTDPSNPDTDGDGLKDEEELRIGTDPRLQDTDGDTITDFNELNLALDPLLSDTDLDGTKDNEDRAPLDPNIPVPQKPEEKKEITVNLESKRDALSEFGDDIPVKEKEIAEAEDEGESTITAVYNKDDVEIKLEIEKQKANQKQKVVISASEKHGYFIEFEG
ncbi:MAG: hypothetical protein AABW87_00065 [Nanoarchaeota archaeon]